MADNRTVLQMAMANLNEYCQKRQLKYEYKDVGVTGPSHDPIFTVKVVIEKREYTPATGKSKKEAKGHAAKLAWDAIQQENKAHSASAPLQQLQLPASPSPLAPQLPHCASVFPDVTSSSPVNYISWLNEYTLKNKLILQYPLKDKSGEDHKPNFSCACEINGKIYGEGTGKNKQTAKFNAAKQAYEKFMSQSDFRTEQSTASINTFLCSSQETSEEESTNGMDSGLECNDKLATKIGAMHLSEVSSPALASPKVPAVKPKRKDTLLAPTFSKLHQRESKYTTNERFLEEYVDIEKIGHGSFGHVFKAKHDIDKKVCAVKRVKLSFEEKEMAAAKREVEVLADLHHENIVRYYGCWIGKDSFKLKGNESSLRDCLFIEMELCEKGTLVDWIDRKRKTKRCKDEALMKFQQIVEGVAYIHSKNLIHRDLKPGNILISKEDKIKISDFGLVTSGIDDQRTEDRGTKRYRAPEQAGNSYGKEVDIFPLGLILLEMLYIFKTEIELSRELDNIKNCIFPQPFNQEFPTEAALIKKMLSKEPCKRPSATTILEFLDRAQRNGLYTC